MVSAVSAAGTLPEMTGRADAYRSRHDQYRWGHRCKCNETVRRDEELTGDFVRRTDWLVPGHWEFAYASGLLTHESRS